MVEQTDEFSQQNSFQNVRNRTFWAVEQNTRNYYQNNIEESLRLGLELNPSDVAMVRRPAVFGAIQERKKRSEDAQKAGSARKTDYLSRAIRHIVDHSPAISEQDLKAKLFKDDGLKFLDAMDHPAQSMHSAVTIVFPGANGKMKTSPISKTKDRMCRAKKDRANDDRATAAV